MISKDGYVSQRKFEIEDKGWLWLILQDIFRHSPRETGKRQTYLIHGYKCEAMFKQNASQNTNTERYCYINLYRHLHCPPVIFGDISAALVMHGMRRKMDINGDKVRICIKVVTNSGILVWHLPRNLRTNEKLVLHKNQGSHERIRPIPDCSIP